MVVLWVTLYFRFLCPVLVEPTRFSLNHENIFIFCFNHENFFIFSFNHENILNEKSTK